MNSTEHSSDSTKKSTSQSEEDRPNPRVLNGVIRGMKDGTSGPGSYFFGQQAERFPDAMMSGSNEGNGLRTEELLSDKGINDGFAKARAKAGGYKQWQDSK